MRSSTSALAFFVTTLALSLAPASARAAEFPVEYTQRPQTLPSDSLELDVFGGTTLPSEPPLVPTFGLRVRRGLSDRFEFGIASTYTVAPGHLLYPIALSMRGILWHSDTASLSLGGAAQLNNGTGLESSLSFGPDAVFFARLGDRASFKLTVGIDMPLTHRDLLSDVAYAAVEPGVQVTDAFAIVARPSIAAPLRAPDRATGGLSLMAVYSFSRSFDLGASVAAPELVSKSGLSLESRVVSAFASFRFGL